jgi:putative transposase
MLALFVALLAAVRSFARSRLELEAEIVALRHQLAVLQRQAPRRLRLGRADRLLWVLLSRLWRNWRGALQIVTPDTVVRWHRRGFALYWCWKSRPRRAGRPAVGADIRALIRQMGAANPLWGAPRIHGELQKLGHELGVCGMGDRLRWRREAHDGAPRSPRASRDGDHHQGQELSDAEAARPGLAARVRCQTACSA